MSTSIFTDDELDDEDPRWLINEQVKGLLMGDGASEDHDAVVALLKTLGLPPGTTSRMHRALCCAERPASAVVKLNLSGTEFESLAAAAPEHIVFEPERNDPRLAELVGVLRLFLEQIEEPPDPNCSCFIAPPCSDCIQHAGLREAFALARDALKKVPEL
jgi:hypothetical protein